MDKLPCIKAMTIFELFFESMYIGPSKVAQSDKLNFNA